jgi:putative transposase
VWLTARPPYIIWGSLGQRDKPCSIDYQAEFGQHGILISMSGKGNCYDNAMVETFFKTLKSELVWRTIFYTRREADQTIATLTGSTIPSGAIPPWI